MRHRVFFAALLGLSACNTPVDPSDISAQPASGTHMRLAHSAAKACTAHAPNFAEAAAALEKAGFVRTTDTRLAAIDARASGIIYDAHGGEVVVQLGSVGRESGCLVGAKGMTPEQAYNLALPWVKHYGAQTNAELGKSLSKKAVQAWGSHQEDRIVFISAQKSWDLLDRPGANARLIYITRK